MPQSSGYLANTVLSAQDFTCLICGLSPTSWTWGDVHGEAMCVQCGTPYQVLQYEDDKQLDKLPRINVMEEWVPILKRYWEETSLFTGLAAIMLPRDYPECVKGRDSFWAWMDKHDEYDYLRKGK